MAHLIFGISFFHSVSNFTGKAESLAAVSFCSENLLRVAITCISPSCFFMTSTFTVYAADGLNCSPTRIESIGARAIERNNNWPWRPPTSRSRIPLLQIKMRLGRRTTLPRTTATPPKTPPALPEWTRPRRGAIAPRRRSRCLQHQLHEQ